ncbi:MAG: PAS domain S-box protein [Alphaproteobacteria bacterium]|nr:PAS domain S-box protein [Alphaproteobacteria bacterium]
MLASEGQFRATFEQAAVGIAHTDAEGRFLRVNQRFCDIVGYDEGDVLHLRFDEITAPEDLEESVDQFGLVVKGETQTYKIEKRYIKKDGSLTWVSLTTSMVRGGHGISEYFVTVIEDINKRKKGEAALLSAIREAEQANQIKSEFLAHFSHELRTPLNAIIGFSEMMQQEILGPIGQGRYKEYVNDIHQSGKHLLTLISDILDLSRIEAGQLEKDEHIFNAGFVAEECVRQLHNRAQDKGVTILQQLPKTGLQLKADERQLRQILLNLLSNAVKFTKENTTVTLQSDIGDDGTMSFHVKDCGYGMSVEEIERVQEPFIRLKSALTSSDEGAGLGLAITKLLAESHDGYLKLTSEIGVGTTATVSFPANRVIQTMAKSGSI